MNIISYTALDGSIAFVRPNPDAKRDGETDTDFLDRLAASVVPDGAKNVQYVAPETAQRPVPEKTYREKRAEAYKTQLGEEPGFEQTTGDVLDAIIKSLYGDKTELDEMVQKIAEIKSANPKP